jgi:hypothetical protein
MAACHLPRATSCPSAIAPTRSSSASFPSLQAYPLFIPIILPLGAEPKAGGLRGSGGKGLVGRLPLTAGECIIH